VRWWALAVLVGAVLLGGAALLFDSDNETEATKLSASVEQALESGVGYDIAVHCKKRPSGDFICPIEEDPGSGASQTILLTLDSKRCWDSRIPFPRGEPNRRVSSYSDCLD
jgi:hypothetical protein